MRSEQSDEQSAEQLQEVKHPEARITHRGICASPDTIFGSHTQLNGALSAIPAPDQVEADDEPKNGAPDRRREFGP